MFGKFKQGVVMNPQPNSSDARNAATHSGNIAKDSDFEVVSYIWDDGELSI
jgi:hypothetical protein